MIALNLAYDWLREKHVVLYFDRPSLIVDEFLEYLATPGATRFLDRQGTVLIVDDVHLDVPRTSRLFSFIYANFTKLSLVFISRPIAATDSRPDSSVYYNFARFAERIDVQSDTVITQLADFYSTKRFGHPVPPPILKAFMEECGSDLLILGRYLKEWTGSSLVNLPEIRKKVFHSVWSDLEKLPTLLPRFCDRYGCRFSILPLRGTGRARLSGGRLWTKHRESDQARGSKRTECICPSAPFLLG